MAEDNGAATPTPQIRFQVVINIDALDRMQIQAPELPLDRVDVIVARARDWCRTEMIAQRVAAIAAERERGITLPSGGPFRLPPPPGRN